MTGVGRTRLAFDGLTTMTAVVTLSWYFVLGPTMQQGGESLLAKLVGTAYPLSDLVLILCLVLLWSRHFEARLRPTILPISLALAMIIVADTIFDYQGLHGGAPSPSMVDPMWSLAALLIGLGAWSLRRLDAVRPTAEEETKARALSRPSLAHSLLPYSLVPITAGLVLYVLIVPSKPGLDGGVYVGGVALFGLVVVRQILALVENARLFDRAAAANSALEGANAALAEANATLTELATTDPITSVLNHRALVEGLEREVARSSRYGHDCSVLFLDLDHFKAINDTYGHMAGDDALRTFAGLVKSHLRGSDVIGRWGGEEFVVVLVETDIAAAMEAAERIRNALAKQHLTTPGGIPMTCSIGVASYPDDGCTTNELVSAADHGVYGAKMLGRNCCFRARDTTSASISQMSAPPGHA